MVTPEGAPKAGPNRFATLAFYLCEKWTNVQKGKVVMDRGGTVDEVALAATQAVATLGMLEALLPYLPTTQYYKDIVGEHFFTDELPEVDDCDDPNAAAWFLIYKKGELGIFDKKEAANMEVNIIVGLAADNLENMYTATVEGDRSPIELAFEKTQREDLLDVIAQFKANYKDLGEAHSLANLLKELLAETKGYLFDESDDEEREGLEQKIQAISLLLTFPQVQ